MKHNLTEEELKEAREDLIQALDIMEMVSTGDLTLTCLLGYCNGSPVYGRVLMTEEHAVWIDEMLDIAEEV